MLQSVLSREDNDGLARYLSLIDGPRAFSAMAIMSMLLFGSAWLDPFPALFRPSIIGTAWGFLFALGLTLGTGTRFRVISLIWSIAALWCSTQLLARWTDVPYDLCRLVCLALLIAGWMFGSAWNAFGAHLRNRFQLWDLALLTLFIAVGASQWALTGSETQAGRQVLGSALLSWLTCSAAVAWALHDRWSWRKLFCLAVCIGLVTGLLKTSWLGGDTLLSTPAELISGPLSVIVSAGCAVLIVTAAARADQARAAVEEQDQSSDESELILKLER